MKDFFFDLGPNLDYHFTKTDSFKKIGIGVGVGLGYDISNKLLFTTGYSFGLSNCLLYTSPSPRD